MAADRLPRAGEHGGLFCVLGYGGHGVQMSVRVGPRMTDVMKGRSEAKPWRELRGSAIPGHFGLPWFLPPFGVRDVLH